MSLSVGIIGAGFAGLAAAYHLAKAGCRVTVLERESQPGGLASGFTDPAWDWTLEQHYHHFFQSDRAIVNLAAQIGHPVNFYCPKTSTYFEGNIYQLDSPLSLLKFSPLPVIDRVRMGGALAFLKANPWWQPLENFTAKEFILTTMGEKAWKIVWEPLFLGKFGGHADQISASWFWARVNPRSKCLGYPDGGFLSLAKSLQKAAQKHGAIFRFNITVDSVQELLQQYDKVICTLPTALLSQVSGLEYPKLSGLGAVNLVLALKQPFLTDGTYWLNINDHSFPFICVTEHTNFVDPKHYGGDYLVYVGNYLPSEHEFFGLNADELLRKFAPCLKRLNPGFNKNKVRRAWVFKAPFAQPVVTKHYSKYIPAMETAIPNLYLANIQQVYPWDRGTNFAVVLGERAAQLCLK